MCLGPSKGLEQTGAAEGTAFGTAMKQASAEFGAASSVFNDLNKSFAPTVAAGPNQQGWSAAEASAINSASINNTAAQYRNAATAVKEAQAAGGGGTVALPSGVNIASQLALSEAGAAQTSSELNQNLVQNYETGRQNYEFASKGLEEAPGVFGTANQGTQASTGAGKASADTQNDITNANNSWMQLATAAISGASSVASAGMCPARGSLYLMADGSEKLVEDLRIGDLLMGIDDQPETIEEIQSAAVPVLRVVTEDGHVARNSRTHAFALPFGGFVVAMHSHGAVVRTALGTSKIISNAYDGQDEVFNVITNGSHTYCADGVWALGVGEAERHVTMERWNEIANSMEAR